MICADMHENKRQIHAWIRILTHGYSVKHPLKGRSLMSWLGNHSVAKWFGFGFSCWSSLINMGEWLSVRRFGSPSICNANKSAPGNLLFMPLFMPFIYTFYLHLLFMPSYIHFHLSVTLFIDSFIHPFIHSFIRSFIHSFIHSKRSLTHS